MKIRETEVQVFLVSFLLLFLETVLYHMVRFTHDYLRANHVVSYALLGLAMGALLYFWVRNRPFPHTLLLCLMPLSMVLAFWNVVRMPRWIFLSPLLVLPFLFGNTLLAHGMRAGNSHRVYGMNLAGSAAGIFFSLWAVPRLKSENALFLCAALFLAWGFGHCLLNGKRIRAALFLAATLFAGLFLGHNMRNGLLDLERVTRCRGEETWPEKIFCGLEREPEKYRYVLSRDNMVSRVSVYSYSPEFAAGRLKKPPGRAGKSHLPLFVCFDGYSTDRITPKTHAKWPDDPRIPFMYSENGGTVRLFEDPPRVLVVGTAAQGIVKPLKHLVGDPSFIRGIEINPSVVDLMRNTFFEYSGRAYEGIAVRRIDARTFFAAPPEETFDVITLLNTFVSRDIGNSRRPDFIHTLEALDRYLEFLEPDGLLLIEERDTDERSRIAGYRLVNTLACLLEKRGARRPGDHFFIYRWNASPALHRFNRYLMAVVGKSPLSARRIDFFSKWLERRRVLETVERLSSVRTRPEHLPPGGTASPYSDFLNASDRDDFLGRGIDLSPATDDRPFLYDVYRQNDSFETLLRRNALAALALLALLLASLACSLRVRSYGSAFLFFVYFVMIGLGYLTLEFAFMNRYQKYTGSPSLSLVFILGVLLVSSGLGAFCSRRFSARTRTILLAAIPLVVIGHLGAGDSLVTALTGSALRNGLLVACSLFPLGFLMGVPLPLGISEIKKRYGERPVPLFYASSCTASAFSILFAHAIMLDFGIKASLGAGAACYALALSLILMLS